MQEGRDQRLFGLGALDEVISAMSVAQYRWTPSDQTAAEHFLEGVLFAEELLHRVKTEGLFMHVFNTARDLFQTTEFEGLKNNPEVKAAAERLRSLIQTIDADAKKRGGILQPLASP